MEELQKQSVKAALNSDWDLAISLNKKILKVNKKDTGTLLRLANAYFSKCMIEDAIKLAKKVIRIEPDNKVARRIIERCDLAKEIKPRKITGSPNLKAFSNNYGTTKLIKLINLGKPSLLASLVPGETLNIILSPQKANIETNDGLHVGTFPDDIASSLWSEREKKHQAIFKSFDKASLVVILA